MIQVFSSLLTIDTYMLHSTMGRKKAGGFIFEWYSGDHEPFHVHIYENNEFIGRFDVVHQKPMGQWVLTKKIKQALRQAGFYEESHDGNAR